MRDLMLAILVSFIDPAVTLVESRWPSAEGKVKRARAFKYVADRLEIIQRIIGPFSQPIDESVIYGLIDAAVLSKNLNEEFERNKKRAAYDIRPQTHFQVTAPNGSKSYVRFNAESGELEPAKLMTGPDGKKIPVPDAEPDEETTDESDDDTPTDENGFFIDPAARVTVKTAPKKHARKK